MKASDQQSPHGVGVDDASGPETNLLRQTPCGISNYATGDELQMPGELKAGSSTQGMTDGSLGDASMADLEQGYVAADRFDPDNPSFTGDGEQDTDTKPDITVSPLNGFLGRPQGWQR